MNADIIIRRATIEDSELIANIGRMAVELSHRDSCSVEDMNHFLDHHYNIEAIQEELETPSNIYHLIYCKGLCAGFSKVIINMTHPNINGENITKLDRIYLREEYYDLKLGQQLLQFNIDFSKANQQSGMWLFTWVGNTRAVNFYTKAGFIIAGSHKFKVTETHYNAHHQMYLRY